MCGIAVLLKLLHVSCPSAVLDRMRDEVAYRGPDDRGSTFFRHCGSFLEEVSSVSSAWEVGLGHRRLSILDLSPAGHQPMHYAGKFWIVYNGEVYNFLELRAELERLGHRFCSWSDTEVILAAYAEWGTSCFARFRGMWGLAILDCVRNEVILCRDRLGIKPLYLWEGSGIVAVASEIKQFLCVPGFTARINAVAAAQYLQTGYENPERSFFQDIQPIRAGSWLRISLDTLHVSTAESYWHPEQVQISVVRAEEAGRLFADKLKECVKIHLRSDVPVGCALSGGLDSSSIAMLAHTLRNDQDDPLHTFTSTFPGEGIDEREYCDVVLAKIHASAHFVTPEPLEFLTDLDRFLWVHDEPVGSFSTYAGYCVARLTRQLEVPVTLNGQGGDEIFSGYWQTYFLHLRDLWRQGRLLALGSHFAGALTGKGNPALVSQVPTMFRIYRARVKPGLQPHFHNTAMQNTGNVLRGVLNMHERARRLHEIRVMFLPQLLKWDDRNSMAFSIESRYPFLDHEMIELCLSFAPRTLFKLGWTKYPLRLGLRDILPLSILQRRSKFGFETPQGKWIVGPLRPIIERWLQSDRPVWNYVRRKDAQRLAEESWQCQKKRDETHKALFRLFVFDRWLSLFGVQC
jgi:asparagine synthase (glutamine-hydrolysing)